MSDLFEKEVCDIKSYHDSLGYIFEVGDKTLDESDQMLRFLRNSGIDECVHAFEDGQRILIPESLRAHLTTRQRRTVQRRITTLNATLRFRRRTRITDVRHVFEPSNGNQRVAEPQSSHHSSNDSLSNDEEAIEPHDSSGDDMEMRFAVVDVQESDEADCVEKNSSSSTTSASAPNEEEETSEQQQQQQQPSSTTADNILIQDLNRIQMQAADNGQTQTFDMAEEDLIRIRQKAFIEQASMFDSLGVTPLQSQRLARKTKETGGQASGQALFGVALSTLINQESKFLCSAAATNVKVPKIFRMIINRLMDCALEEEGIFRVGAALTKVNALRAAFDAEAASGDFYKSSQSNSLCKALLDASEPSVCAALLKLFLRELPVPLFTWELIEAFYAVHCVADFKLNCDSAELQQQQSKSSDETRRIVCQQLTILNYLVLALPSVHQCTLKLLLEFLSHVATRFSANKMSELNLAKVFAPNLFLHLLPQRNFNTLSAEQQLSVQLDAAQHQIRLTLLLLRYRALLWLIPENFLCEIREQVQRDRNATPSSKKRSQGNFKKIFGKRDKYNLGETVEKGSIRVIFENVVHTVNHQKNSTCCNGTKISSLIKLTETLTAADVVEKICSSTSLAQQKGLHHWRLYEIGGNLSGHRALFGKTLVASVLRLNPEAELQVKLTPDYFVFS